jgi:Cu+-exporting ATPase
MNAITHEALAVVDPVCGMSVDPSSAAASATHAGKVYHFCSTHCRDDLLADPARYAPAAPTRPAAPPPARPVTAAAAGMPMQQALRRGTKDLAKDPVCGMVVDKATALRTDRGGRSYYFCSVGCQRTERLRTALKAPL